jgi:hypothetical protein
MLSANQVCALKNPIIIKRYSKITYIYTHALLQKKLLFPRTIEFNRVHKLYSVTLFRRAEEGHDIVQ